MTHRDAIGRYQIVGQLATGGMAEILLGKLLGPSGFERAVVIKRILPHLATQTQFREMFLDEARTLAKLRHPNVVQVHELGQDGDELFLVLEYLDGESAYGLMRRLLRARETLPYSLGMHVVSEAAAGLHAAHELMDDDGALLGLVHRDVSPQNIHVLYNGQVKLLDFGIAKATDSTVRTEAGHVKGKFAYMSPEQCRGDDLDRRSDIFSLGIVLYELTTARRVFARKSDLMTMKAICEGPIVRPSRIAPGYPRRLEEIVMRCLTRLREERYQTAMELRRELLGLRRELSGDPVPESVLASLMTRAFEDRIAEKREMLRRIRSGADVTVVPAAEADPSVDIPILIDESELDPEPPKLHRGDGAAPVPPPIPPEPLPRRTVGRWIAGLVVLLSLVVGVVWFLRSGGGEPAPGTPAPIASSPTEVVDVPAPAPPEPRVGEIAEIEVHVESTPADAEVRLGGELRGRTPLSLSFEPSDEPLTLSISEEGYEDLEEVVVPDVTQRVRVTLVQTRTRSRSRRSPSKMRGMGAGFRRFD